jgi:MFS family permease
MAIEARAAAAETLPEGVETPYAWRRLVVSLVISTIGGIGLWSSIVVLPAIQAEFGLDRAGATLPYTATMLGFAFGGIIMGRLADRFGVIVPVAIGASSLSLGYLVSAHAANVWQFAAAQGIAIGLFGSAATFGPLLADVSHWFTRNRGTAVGICASGNYLSGTIWPPILQHLIATIGWRETHLCIAILCATTILPLALLLRRPTPVAHAAPSRAAGQGRSAAAPTVSPTLLQGMLVLAGLGCCVAMSMPQVHIVAYCGDLGYGPARGAEMLSLMLGLGVVSRLCSGWVSDRIGGVRTLLLGSFLQCVTLFLYLPFDGLASLYIVSALFGLSQGGIVPSYAMIVREYFPAREAGGRLGVVLMATIIGMALGGWMSGEIFDLTGSYQAAFVNGILWNLMNLSIATWLLYQPRGRALAA